MLPVSLHDLKTIFGPANGLWEKGNRTMIANNAYQLQENIEYFLKPPSNLNLRFELFSLFILSFI